MMMIYVDSKSWKINVLFKSSEFILGIFRLRSIWREAHTSKWNAHDATKPIATSFRLRSTNSGHWA